MIQESIYSTSKGLNANADCFVGRTDYLMIAADYDESLLMWRKKVVLVGIHEFDSHSKELLDWALVKVADPGDIVLAIHVVSPYIHATAKQRDLLVDAYLEDYQGLCKEKQVTLNIQFFKGYSLRRVMVREAHNQSASAVILGITKHTASRLWGSIAKYCAKKLPPTTQVMSVHNGKILFSRRHLQGPGQDPKPTFYFNGNFTFKGDQSEFGESEMSDISGFSFDGRDGKVICLNSQDVTRPFQRHGRGLMSLSSLRVEDSTGLRPGWPLLQTASSITQPAIEARNLSVVQWVMNLPHRSLSSVSESNSYYTNTTDAMEEKENGILQEIKTLAGEKSLPNALELIFTKKSADCEFFSRDVLKVSTSNFSEGNLIGKGGSNSVYKGILPEGKQVAVKILEPSKDSWKEFIQEVDIMTTLKHTRITPLLGICVEENDLISVYNCLSRGNLEENLHGNSQKNVVTLPWEARYRIAVGIAEALNYLHHECTTPIIHRDIKSSNILLTDELEPQLSDFGLAIWGPTNASFFMDSDVVGTFGYLAPEYFMYGKVSNKMDVYAFGVVLLELLSGRKPINGLSGTTEAATKAGQESLIMWAKPKLERGELQSMLDPNLEGNIDVSQIQMVALAASRCLIQAARLRPDMSQILNILNGAECADTIKQTYRYEPCCSENEDENDDEVYPESCAESHLSLAFQDVNYELSYSTSLSSLDHQISSPISVEEYLRKSSRSSSLE